MNEEWKDIPSYVGIYQASTFGNIRSIDHIVIRSNGVKKSIKGQVLKPCEYDKYGHLMVTFKVNGVQKHRTVHSLIAETFLGERPNGMDIRHLDGNPRNNRVENLSYGTKSENMIDCSMQCNVNGQKLNEDKVKEIRSLLNGGIPHRKVAEMFNVHPSSIMDIKLGRSYSWVEKEVEPFEGSDE